MMNIRKAAFRAHPAHPSRLDLRPSAGMTRE
jgi:hypothetical protein